MRHIGAGLSNAFKGVTTAVTDTAGFIGSQIGKATGMSYTVNLNGTEITRLLAAAAEDVYDFSGQHTAERLVLEHQQLESFGSGNGLQFGIYTVNGG